MRSAAQSIPAEESDTAETVVPHFHALLRRHKDMVFSIALHHLQNREAAEEVAQDVFFQLHQKLSGIESDTHAVNWLRKVATTRSIDCLRRGKVRASVPLEDAPEPATPADPADPLLGRKLRVLIASLPEKPRSVMILRFQEDLTPEEIAKTLGMPIGTVKSHLQRSLATLREKMGRMVGEGL